MYNIGSHLDSTLKSRAANLHANNVVLEKQLTELQSSTKALAKETDKLKKVADDAARKLKELGNVQNWAEVMEREMLILEETMRLANESEEEDYGPCRVCGRRVEESGDDLLWCRGCDGEFHLPCVGLDGVPKGEWFCAECQQQGTYLQSVNGAETVPGTASDEEMGGGRVTDGAISDGAITGAAIDDGVITDVAITGTAVTDGIITDTAITEAVAESGDIVMGGVDIDDKEVDGVKGKENEAVVIIQDTPSQGEDSSVNKSSAPEGD